MGCLKLNPGDQTEGGNLDPKRKGDNGWNKRRTKWTMAIRAPPAADDKEIESESIFRLHRNKLYPTHLILQT